MIDPEYADLTKAAIDLVDDPVGPSSRRPQSLQLASQQMTHSLSTAGDPWTIRLLCSYLLVIVAT